ncbi:MAG TPA: hypothetical protein VG892_07600 [Terriglobales bacterium]|nr:hypothetical protein [Terriglobales bacterium]
MADDSEVIGPAQGLGEDPDTLWKIARYVEEIELYGKETQKWDNRCKEIIRRYKDDRKGDGAIEDQERRFNALWSITQNLLPICYSRNPKPDIQRRFKDADPVGRVTSDVLERTDSFFCDTDDFAAVSRGCVLDYLLGGRGTLWVRYVPYFRPDTEITQNVGPGDDDTSQAEAPQVIDYEDVICDYVHREDFGHNVKARTWAEVWLVWRKVYMTRRELIERFAAPEEGGKANGKLTLQEISHIPLDWEQKDTTGKILDNGVKKAVIYEMWDKTRRIAVWAHKDVPKALDLRKDPLRLDNFFPTPKPLLVNLTNENLIPTPLYVEYQDQAIQLDLLTNRIAQMTKCLKVIGVSNFAAEGLNRMFNEGTENELIPIQQWSLFAEAGGIKGNLDMFDITMIAAAINDAYAAREQVKKDLDEIMGISDIVRGATDPNETATAQSIKSNYANQRISDMQREVQRFVRETIRIMTNIIANHFQIETIKQISGVRLLTQEQKQILTQQGSQSPAQAPGMAAGPSPSPLGGQPPQIPELANVTPDQLQQMMDNPTWEEVNALIRDNAMRSFRIDIETDSTIRADEEAEKASRVEFLKAAGGFLQQAVEAGAQQPAMIPLLGQMLMFGIRAFPVGKELEGTFQATIQKLEKDAANPQQKPDPAILKAQLDAQTDQQKLQAQVQLENAKTAGQIEVQKAQLIGDQQASTAKLSQEKELAQYQMQLKAETDQHENQLEFQRRLAEMENEYNLERMRLDSQKALELEKALIQKETAIEVARINAKAIPGDIEEDLAESQGAEMENSL